MASARQPVDLSMSSPRLPTSDDDLFGIIHEKPVSYETVDTVPVTRLRDSPEHDTLVSLPPLVNSSQANPRAFNTQSQYGNAANNKHTTQPTQLIDRSSPPVSSPLLKPIVQVAASSPMAPATAPRRPGGILASAMAPAGTAFRKPFVAPSIASRKTINIDSDDDDRQPSDDSDREEQARSNIKTSTFVRKSAAEKVPESPQQSSGLSRFQQIARGYAHRPTDYLHGTKRSSDTMANAYGNVSKRPRQVGPSRAQPVASHGRDEESDIDIDDIDDAGLRTKTSRLRSICPSFPIRDIYKALQTKHGSFDDAMSYLLEMSERKARDQNRSTIDLTEASEDELMMTPAAKNRKQAVAASAAIPVAKQQPRRPAQSIQEKWSNTQTTSRKTSGQNKKLEIFDDPGPAVPKARKLVRGRRDRSPESVSEVRQVKGPEPHKTPVVIDDDTDGEGDSRVHSDAEEGQFNNRLLKFFNSCTAMDLADTANISREIAEHFVSKQPFRSLEAVDKVENPNLKPSKSKRRAAPMGEKVVEKVNDMLRSYEAVDFLVKKCESIAKPLVNEMKGWGINIFGKSDSGELDVTNLSLDLQSSGGSHDSGLGTPISDDDRDVVGSRKNRKVFGQPMSMAEDITMKDYQVVGVNWLSLLFRNNYSCILADDMGLGKTLQTIAFIAHLAETGVKGPHLIVVPAATLENWLKEFHRFCPGLAVEPYYANNPSERFELREQLDDMRDEVNVVITTYTIAKAKDDFPWLRTYGFVCTIFDEGHYLKNAESKVSKNLMKIQSKWRLLLTGTPLQNNLRELMSLLSFLMPAIFKQKQEELEVIFKQDIKTINQDDENREMLLSKKRIARARSMLTPFILRRKKWQVLKDLPKKDRKVEFCEMNVEQEAIYNGWLARAFDIRERRARGERVPLDETSNILMKLRQAAIHPLLFRHNYPDGILPKIAKTCLKDPMWAESNPDLIVQELQAYSDFEVHQLCARSTPLRKFTLDSEILDRSGKVQALIRLLKQFISEGHRVLIFSQFVMVLDILELVLSHHDMNFFRLDGNTKVSERQDLIDEFNEEIEESDPEYQTKKAAQVPIFMLSTKAGGAGINLASASRVIIFDSGFNPQDDVQAENRAHRIGQKREVEVWRLITKGSVEEQIYSMGEIKLRLDREVAGEGAENDEAGGDGGAGKGVGDKKSELAEMQGMKTVEEMLFKKLEAEKEEEKKKDTTTADVDASNDAQDKRQLIHDLEHAKDEDETLNIADDTTKDDPNVPSADAIKPEPETHTAATISAPPSSSMPASRRKDSVEMASRPKVAAPKRPKIGSRSSSTRSVNRR